MRTTKRVKVSQTRRKSAWLSAQKVRKTRANAHEIMSQVIHSKGMKQKNAYPSPLSGPKRAISAFGEWCETYPSVENVQGWCTLVSCP